MKQLSFVCSMIIVCGVFVLTLAGCISVPNSPSPRFYMLRAIDKNQGTGQESNIAANLIIEVGPVKIPEYQNRPQIVTQNRDKMLNFAQFDRWGESLDLALARLINENLAAMLPGVSLQMFPCTFVIPLDYQIIADVLQLESELNKDMFFVVQWSLIDVKNKKMMVTKRSEFREPIIPHNYAGLAKTLSRISASLCNEIAEKISSLEKAPEIKSKVTDSKK